VKKTNRVWIAVGSNVGDRAGYLGFGVRETCKLPGTKLIVTSPVYETTPVGPVADQPAFLNAVFEVETGLSADAVLDALQGIERAAGRLPEGERVHWGPRQLDLDILIFGHEKVQVQRLVLPHPRMHERWFVMRPLADVAPNMLHPVSGVAMKELVAHLEAQEPVAPGHRVSDRITEI
jgi:2-amino-4-hydroxy-6-hydroxymethyldihydropteridine diphosphokinase